MGQKIGHTTSEETKRKIGEKARERMKGKLPDHLKGYWIGRKQSPEHKEKTLLSLNKNPHRYKKGMISPMRGRKNLAVSGEKHWNWKGGITPIYMKIRRERLKENGGFHTLGEWETLKAQYDWTCRMCQKKEPEIKLTKDHIIPVTKGGSNNIENIQPLCTPCNSKKNNKLMGDIQIPNNRL